MNSRCHLCYNVFKCSRSVSKHIRQFHKSLNQVQCDQCDKVFSNLYNLSVHKLKIHSKTFRYECEKCAEFKCQEKSAFIQHLKEKHGTENESINSNYRLKNRQIGTEHKCNLCDYKTKVKQSFTRHLENVHKVFLQKCKFCHKESKDNHICFVKMKIVENLDKLTVKICQICDEKFENLSDLKSHYLENHAENCPEVLDYQKRGKTEHKSEDFSQIFLCDQCPFITDSLEKQNQHVIKCHQQKFGCEYCPFSLQSMEKLSKHIAENHPGMPTHYCLKCPLWFP